MSLLKQINNAWLKTRIWVLRCLLLAASATFAAGIYLPMITITKLMFFTNEFSILSGIAELFREQKYFVFVLLAGFSIVLPVLKLATLYRYLFSRKSLQRHWVINWMHRFGKWSMLDVLVVAIIIVVVKLGALATVEVHQGLYLFSVSVFLIMLVTNQTLAMIAQTPKLENKLQTAS